MQAVLDEFRGKAASVGLMLRPSMHGWLAPSEPQQESPETASSTSPNTDSVEYSDCQVGFVRCKIGKLGVLQLHKAKLQHHAFHFLSVTSSSVASSLIMARRQVVDLVPHSFGYAWLFRVEEIWPMLARTQPFHNWFCKAKFDCIY